MSSTSSTPDEVSVWGDELLERGDPLGEIIALARTDSLALSGLQSHYEKTHFRDVRPVCTWKNGIIDEIKLKTTWGREGMDEITRCPATRFLRTLDFHVELEGHKATDATPILLERGLPKSLRDLTLWLREGETDFRRLYPLIANVEQLSLWEPKQLGVMDLPKLISLRVLRFRKDKYGELVAAKLPALSTFEVFACPWTEFEGLDLPHAPKLDTLVLGRPAWEPWISGTDEYLRERARREWQIMLGTPLANRVRRLEISGTLGREREITLFDFIPSLERYERIQLAPTRSADLRSALEVALGERLVWKS